METTYHIKYTIAEVTIEIISFLPVKVLEDFRPFVDSERKAQYRVEFCRAAALSPMEGSPAVSMREYAVYREKSGAFLYDYYDRCGKIYARSRFEAENKKLTVRCLPEGEEFIKESGSSFFHVRWERILIREKKVILHSSCVYDGGGGILFCGPSGIGKSTQAGLWCRYKGKKLLNGDRTILGRKQNGWYAHGSPYAGSSRCYVNDSCPVLAIVMLRQASRSVIRRIKKAEAFRAVFGQITVNSWDEWFAEAACDLVLCMIGEIPVYELACTPDKDAVDLLEKKLTEDR